MSLHTYDPKQMILVVGGIPITGFVDGTFVEVERTSDSFTKHVGADGITSRAKIADKSGSMKFMLQRTSLSNDVLSAFLLADELSPGGIPLPLMVKDLNGATTAVSGFGWIKKPAKIEDGKEIAQREWTLECADLDVFVGGNASLGS